MFTFTQVCAQSEGTRLVPSHTSEIAHEDREVAWCGAAVCARAEGAGERKHESVGSSKNLF